MKKYNQLTFVEKMAFIKEYPEQSLNDKDWSVRIASYRVQGFTLNALNDEDYDIRIEAYRALGFTKDALNDEDSDIRLEAYRVLGFTLNALYDEDCDIIEEAKIYLDHFKEIKKMEVKKIKISMDKEYTTRDGRKVKVFCIDLKGDYPVLAVAYNYDYDNTLRLDEYGNCVGANSKHEFDLIEVPQIQDKDLVECWYSDTIYTRTHGFYDEVNNCIFKPYSGARDGAAFTNYKLIPRDREPEWATEARKTLDD
jgi:hypothetical protein